MARNSKPPQSLRILLTAAEAYPALEEAFLDARSEIWASFLVFDLSTRLRSARAKTVGRTWLHLMVHTLNRGVSVNFSISDVDTVGRADMHRSAVRHLRMFHAAAEMAVPGAKLVIRRSRHPCETGLGIRVWLWPYVMRKLYRISDQLNRMPDEHRRAALRDMPDLVRNLHTGPTGNLRPRLLSLPKLFPLTHHQKLCVIDRKLLYIGGLDLDERRFDTPLHRQAGDQTWHDLQLMLTGPVVTEAQAHLESFLDVTAGTTVPARPQHLLRTLSRKRGRNLFNFGPKPLIDELRQAHYVLAERARSLIYIETQYFRDRALAHVLAGRARANPQLQMILILPAAPDDVAFERSRSLDARFGEALQASALRIVRRAFGSRLFVGSPAQPRKAPPVKGAPDHERRDQLYGAPLIYVHAKVSIFDDAAAIVSSANLNGRSLSWDTEAGVVLDAPNDVRELRHRVMAHWLPVGIGEQAFHLVNAAQSWAAIARSNARSRPADRAGYLLPHDFAAAETFGRRLPVIPAELV